MSTYVELATAPSADTPHTCIHVRHERCQYVFGRIAEGTQRALNARKISFAGTSQMFLSGPVGWDQMGGLIGFLLSTASATSAAAAEAAANNIEREKRGLKVKNTIGQTGVGIHAGDNISHVLASSKGYIFRQPLHLRLHEYQDQDDIRARGSTTDIMEPDWQDEQIRVWKIPTTRARSSSPPKRRHSDSERPEQAPRENGPAKQWQASEDYRLAKFIIEEDLFNGSGRDQSLVETTVGALESTDTALIRDPNGIMKVYQPSSDGDLGLSASQKVWKISPSPPAKGSDPFLVKGLRLPRATYTTKSMSYIMKTHDRRGKFDRAAADALGVPKANFKSLIQGESVQTEDGKTITPDMVMGAPIPGTGIIVADIESHEFLQSFMERPEWKNTKLMSNITLMYWMIGPNMSENDQIQKFMRDHPTIRHILCAPDTCPNMLTMDTASELQVKLRRIDPERFPIPVFDNRAEAKAPPTDSNIEFGRLSKRVQLMPRVLFDDGNIAPFPDLVTAANANWDSELESLTKAAKVNESDPQFLAQLEESQKDIPNLDAEITCLGTGSSAPSKYRNVSGTLVQVPGIGNYLFDAGEGTLGQIRRLYGFERATEILRNLRCVVISHLHADHHLGAPSILKAWYNQALQDGSKAKLAVACNPRFREALSDVSQIEDFGYHRLVFPSQPRDTDSGAAVDVPRATAPFHKAEGDNFGLKAIKRIPVPHCWRSMATELELTSGLRIAYSGDCRPSSAFAEKCKGAHLLIHECTFGDDMISHAKAKNHTTISEALHVSREMGARRTLLTHFSQRYIKQEALRLSEEQKRGVLMGFDFMTVKLGDFAKAACYLPALEKFMEKLMDKEGPSE